MENLVITILKEDFDNATDYYSNSNCPMAVAFRRSFPDIKMIGVDSERILVSEGKYYFKQTDVYNTWTLGILERSGQEPGDSMQEGVKIIQEMNPEDYKPIVVNLIYKP